ncbi:MAG: NnrS family protein [Pseudomonadota bacterium]
MRSIPAARGHVVPLLQNGFRPFFLGGALWLAFATPYWLWLLLDGRSGWSRLDPLAWHQHETLFGGIGAIVVGFLLTAVPNWTGRLPLRGRPLLLMALLWAVARGANLTSSVLPPWLAPLLDAGFLTAVTLFASREIWVGRNWRNLPLVGLVGAFALAAWGSHLASLGIGDGDVWRRFGIAAVVLLVGLIGGRVVPSFTTNWLKKRGEAHLPIPFGRFDVASLALLAVTMLAWTVAPDARLTAWVALAAGVVHLVRLARWCGHRTLAEPLVTILHVGYLWVGVGLVLVGLVGLVPALVGLNTTHALTAGALGTMTLAVMTRASLGHTGRALVADGPTIAIYALVVLGALVRVVGDVAGMGFTTARLVAALAWSGAYLGFALHYGPMLVRPRTDAVADGPAGAAEAARERG